MIAVLILGAAYRVLRCREIIDKATTLLATKLELDALLLIKQKLTKTGTRVHEQGVDFIP